MSLPCCYFAIYCVTSTVLSLFIIKVRGKHRLGCKKVRGKTMFNEEKIRGEGQNSSKSQGQIFLKGCMNPGSVKTQFAVLIMAPFYGCIEYVMD